MQIFFLILPATLKYSGLLWIFKIVLCFKIFRVLSILIMLQSRPINRAHQCQQTVLKKKKVPLSQSYCAHVHCISPLPVLLSPWQQTKGGLSFGRREERKGSIARHMTLPVFSISVLSFSEQVSDPVRSARLLFARTDWSGIGECDAAEQTVLAAG